LREKKPVICHSPIRKWVIIPLKKNHPKVTEVIIIIG